MLLIIRELLCVFGLHRFQFAEPPEFAPFKTTFDLRCRHCGISAILAGGSIVVTGYRDDN